jgi:DNA polymerase-3 subunit alpha
MMALYRPGPLQSGMADDFVERRHGRKKVSYPLPQLQEILSDTYGVILYQEQVMEIAKALAGFTMGQADVLRKAMGKKDDALMEKQKGLFLEGARANGIDEKKAAEIFELVRQFGGYGFNKSHSTAYALVAYQTAWLKTHYPVEFYSALMTSESGDTDKIIRYIAHCREKGIPILPPDVNESRYAFFPSGAGIRFGLSAIKGLGASAVESIIEARADRPFESIPRFPLPIDLTRSQAGRGGLIKSGALDSLDPDRGRVFGDLPALLEEAQAEMRRRESGQFALFCAPEEPKKPPAKARDAREGAAPDGPGVWSRRERLALREGGARVLHHGTSARLLRGGDLDVRERHDVRPRGHGSRGGSQDRRIVTQVRERTTRKGDKMASIVPRGPGRERGRDGLLPGSSRMPRHTLSSPDPVFVVGRLKQTDKGWRSTPTSCSSPRMCGSGSRSRCISISRRGARTGDIEDLARAIRRYPGDMKAVPPHRPGRGFDASWPFPTPSAFFPVARPGPGAEVPVRVRILRLH